MRFGRRNKLRPPLLRNDKTETPPISSGTVASEERSALLASNLDEMDEGMDYDTGQSEPTQALLTALGRFQRQVAKAQTGARQDEWSDECMNHLIGAVEIAIEQDWVDVVEALTDTARLLHSYEDANRANRCVPFLADSYELLCLMVGDLIVDNVRPSVMDKWRRRYDAALDDLKTEGLRLIQDDESMDPAPASASESRVARIEPVSTSHVAKVVDEPAPFADVAAVSSPDPDLLEDELPALGDLPPLQGVERVGVEPIAASRMDYDDAMNSIEPMSVTEDADSLPEMPMIGNVGYLPTDPEPSILQFTPAPARPVEPEPTPASVIEVEEAMPVEARPHTFEELESGFDTVETPAPEADTSPWDDTEMTPIAVDAETVDEADEGLSEEPIEEDEREALYQLDEPPSRRNLEPAVVQHLDALCDELARLERHAELDHAMVLSMIDGRLDSLRIHAHSGRRPRAEELCGTMADLCRRAVASPDLMNDKFFELAYGFCGLYVDADGDEDSTAESAWLQEAATHSVEASPFDTPEVNIAPTDADPAAAIQEDVVSMPDALDLAEEVARETWAEEASETQPARVLESIGHAALPVKPASASVAEALLSLLTGAQNAAAQGDIAHAKELALQAAVRIAEAEVDQAEGVLSANDEHLEVNRTALEEAHVGAATAEAQVGVCEAQVTDCEAGLAETRHRIETTQGHLTTIEQHIASIEEQIRALQAERDAEAQRAAEVHASLDQERTMEEAGVSELDQRIYEESQARERLEEARRRIEALERERDESRAGRKRAEANLEEKRQSLVELEQTVRLIQERLGGHTR